MRIAVDARSLQGEMTGVGRYLEGLLGAWTDLCPDDRFVLLGSRPVAVPPALAGRVEASSPRVPLPGTLWLQAAAPAAAARAGCDLFFAPLGIAPLAAPMPCVVTIHDLTPLLFPRWHRAKNVLGFVPLLGASVRKARAIATVSDATRRDLLDVFPDAAGRCFTVHNGVTLPSASRTEDGQYVLFLGTLEPRKNVLRLVEAMERIWDADPSFPRLELAGGAGWGLPGLAGRLRSSRHAARIRWRGYAEPAEAARLLANARLLAYPSLYEGFGLPVLEAMALGTPVVASSSSSLPEVAGDAALLPDPEDVGAIAAALVRAARDEAWRAAAREKGRARAARFTWAAAAGAMRALCAGALAS